MKTPSLKGGKAPERHSVCNAPWFLRTTGIRGKTLHQFGSTGELCITISPFLFMRRPSEEWQSVDVGVGSSRALDDDAAIASMTKLCLIRTFATKSASLFGCCRLRGWSPVRLVVFLRSDASDWPDVFTVCLVWKRRRQSDGFAAWHGHPALACRRGGAAGRVGCLNVPWRSPYSWPLFTFRASVVSLAAPTPCSATKNFDRVGLNWSARSEADTLFPSKRHSRRK